MTPTHQVTVFVGRALGQKIGSNLERVLIHKLYLADMVEQSTFEADALYFIQPLAGYRLLPGSIALTPFKIEAGRLARPGEPVYEPGRLFTQAPRKIAYSVAEYVRDNDDEPVTQVCCFSPAIDSPNVEIIKALQLQQKQQAPASSRCLAGCCGIIDPEAYLRHLEVSTGSIIRPLADRSTRPAEGAMAYKTFFDAARWLLYSQGILQATIEALEKRRSSDQSPQNIKFNKLITTAIEILKDQIIIFPGAAGNWQMEELVVDLLLSEARYAINLLRQQWTGSDTSASSDE